MGGERGDKVLKVGGHLGIGRGYLTSGNES